MAIVGNKSDLLNSSEVCVDEKEVEEFAKKYNAEFRLVSALDGNGVDDLFFGLISIFDQNKDKYLLKNQETRQRHFTLPEKPEAEEEEKINKQKKKCCH